MKPLPAPFDSPLPFTGERFVPGQSGDIEAAHVHRYAWACQLAAGLDVLDIACGEGYGSAMLASVAKSVAGVDIDAATVENARARYRADGLSFQEGSCDKIPLPDHSVDLAVSFETIEHHSAHEAMLLELRRVLRPGGRLLISSPDKLAYARLSPEPNHFHPKELLREEFESLIRTHFKHSAFFSQDLVHGSLILPEGATARALNLKWQDGRIVERGHASTFILALASDAALPALAGGTYEGPMAPAPQAPPPSQAPHSEAAELVQVLAGEIKRMQGTGAWRWAQRYWAFKNSIGRLFRGQAPAKAPAPSAPLKVTAPREDPGQERALQLQSRAADLQRPLPLQIVPGRPARINVLISVLDFDYVFAGYLGMLQLARQLARRGHAVRVIATDSLSIDPERARAGLARCGLGGMEKEVEFTAVGQRDNALPVSADDHFVATSAWTAHLAHQACQAMRERRFYFLTQEYEPFFFPGGRYYAYAHESYGLPQVRLFSTTLLRDYYEALKLPADADGAGARPKALHFMNAVPRLALDETAMRTRRPRRLLFYARVEAHTERNLFGLGLRLLKEAVGLGLLDPAEWEFHAIGSLSPQPDLELGRGAVLRFQDKLGLEDYYAMLPGYDLGLSLMMSVHPSLPPLDMAAAGMLVLNNSFPGRSGADMAAISSNILAVEPALPALMNGLRDLLGRLDDVPGRIKGAELNWCRDWEDAFGPEIQAQWDEFFGRPKARA